MMSETLCVVCFGDNSNRRCSKCSSVLQSSSDCLAKDASNPYHNSSSYTILHEDRCGRLLMADRDISRGEVVFTDIAGAMGPDINPRPLCLNCYKTLPGLIYRCKHCSLPLCSPFCQIENGPHSRECSLFQEHSPRYANKSINKGLNVLHTFKTEAW